MSDVIDFLERLGHDSSLRYAPRSALDRALSDAQVHPELRAAFANRNQRLLEALLGAEANVCCMVNIPVEGDEVDTQKTKEDRKAASAAEHVSLIRVA